MSDKKNNKLPKVSSVEAETTIAILTTNTYQQAAEKLGISDVALFKRRRKFNIDEKIEELPIKALERLKIGSLKAAEELVRQVDSAEIRDRNKAANDVLGYVVPKQGNNIAVQVNFNKIAEHQKEKYDI